MIFGILYAVCFFICYLPQIYRTIRYKSVEGLSFSMFLLSLLGYIFCGMYMIYGVGFNIGMAINSILGTICCLLMMFYIIKYKTN
jgi:uncharacterized protein with PQ loop repeat